MASTVACLWRRPKSERLSGSVRKAVHKLAKVSWDKLDAAERGGRGEVSTRRDLPNLENPPLDVQRVTSNRARKKVKTVSHP